MKSKSGFTLIEIMIVIVIIAVSLSFSIPSFRDSTIWSKDGQVKVDIKKLNHALDYIRSQYGMGAIPDGKNDTNHHKKVLNLISSHIESNVYNPAQFRSTGTGSHFYFTGYGNSQVAIRSNEAPDAPSFKWHLPGRTRNTLEAPTIPKRNKYSSNILDDLDDFIKKRHRSQAKLEKVVYFENPGNFQWIVPEEVEEVTIEAIGAGGSGAKVLVQPAYGPREYRKDLINNVCANRSKTCRMKGDHYLGKIGSGTIVGPGKFELLQGRLLNIYGTGKMHFYNSDGSFNVTKTLKHENDGNGTNFITRFSLIIPVSGEVHYDVYYEESQKCPISKSVGLLELFYLTFSKLITREFHGGGGAGGYLKKNIKNLRGGETVFLTVGEGRIESNGGDTHVRINDISMKAMGGEMGLPNKSGTGGNVYGGDIAIKGNNGKPGPEGAIGGQGSLKSSSGLVYRGSGGSGKNPNGGPGQHGMVKITYRG